MESFVCCSMTAIRKMLLKMPDKNNSFCKINGVLVERTGTDGWCVTDEGANLRFVSGLARTTMRLTIMSQNVAADLFDNAKRTV